jgi:hypothetical protein
MRGDPILSCKSFSSKTTVHPEFNTTKKDKNREFETTSYNVVKDFREVHPGE